MDTTDKSAIVAIPERLFYELDAISLGAYAKLKYLCDKEADKIFKTSWNALAFIAVSKTTLKMLQDKGLIRWMETRNTQIIQMMEP